MFALVLDGKVVQIATVQFPVAPALEWVDLTGVMPPPEVGWSYDGVGFVPPPPPPPPPPPRQQIIDRLRADAVLKAQVLAAAKARGITDKQVILAELEAEFAETIP